MPYKPELSCFIRRAMSLIEPGKKMKLTLLRRGGNLSPYREVGMVITKNTTEIESPFHSWIYTTGHATLGVSLVRTIRGFHLKLSNKWIPPKNEVKDYW